MLGLVAAVLAFAGLALPLAHALIVKRETVTAAESAALAAADTAVGILSGFPCQAAARVAEANGTDLDACVADGFVVTVRVRSAALGMPVLATATAGPP